MNDKQHLPSHEKDPHAEKPGLRACKAIERALKNYEASAALAEAFVMLFTKTQPHIHNPALQQEGVVKNWESFREYLLHAHSNDRIKTFNELLTDIQRFLPSAALIQFDRVTQGVPQAKTPFGITQRIGTTADRIDMYLLLQLVLWTQKSRKITSLKESTVKSFVDPREPYPMTWGDVLLPYDSFVIEAPPRCLRHTVLGTDVQLSALIVSQGSKDGKDFLMVRLLWEEAAATDRVTNTDELLLNAAKRAKKKGWNTASLQDFITTQHQVDAKPETTKPGIDMQGITLRFDMTASVDSDADDAQTRAIKRIVAGTCMYMASAREGDEEPQGSKSHPVREGTRTIHPRRPTVENVVSDASSVLTIDRVTHFSPTRNTFRYIDATGTEQGAHVVRKHMRRRPNTPKDAVKDVKVPSYWKGLDALPQGVVPGIAVSQISTKES